MSKGVIVKQPGGGMPNGKIMVTEGTINNADGTATAVDAGTIINFTEASTSPIGALVSFDFDTSTTGKGITTIKEGTILTGTLPDVVKVQAGEVTVINGGRVDGKVVVKGGTLLVMGSSLITGKLECPTAGSVVLVDNQSTIDGKMEVKSASIVSVRNSTIDGKLSTDGTNFTAVVNCTIKGKLKVLNTKDCYTSGNTIDSGMEGTCRS